jgi:hypothetical protein
VVWTRIESIIWLWRRRSQGIGNEPGIGRPRSPCEMRESLRQVERALGEVRKPKCQRMEG